MASCENKSEQLLVDEINHLSYKAQCELIADEFANVPYNYPPLHTQDIRAASRNDFVL
jgi:hypothetical protein